MYCEHCGQKMQEGEKFCANCGHYVVFKGANPKQVQKGQANKQVYNVVITAVCVVALITAAFFAGAWLSAGGFNGNKTEISTEAIALKQQTIEETETAASAVVIEEIETTAPVIVAEIEKEDVVPKKKTTYSKYTNPRYGFSVSYPTFLNIRSVADNLDGIECESDDGEVSMAAYGSYYFDSKRDYYEYSKEAAYYEITYFTFKDSWFVLSGYDNDYIVYEKHFLNDDNTENVFIIRYPEGRKKEFDPIINYMVKNFKAGNS